jgi:hypothetical protein
MMAEAENQNFENLKKVEEQYKSLIASAEDAATQAKADLNTVEERWV